MTRLSLLRVLGCAILHDIAESTAGQSVGFTVRTEAVGGFTTAYSKAKQKPTEGKGPRGRWGESK